MDTSSERDIVWLSTTVTISDYNAYLDTQNREKLAEFIRERFTERYITPLRVAPKKKNGFCTMAICCLMVESLESFWQGWENTRGKDENGNKKDEFAFHYFFKRYPPLNPLYPYAHDFYVNIRCGILHQAESTGGWRILRKGPLFDQANLTINATNLHQALGNYIDEYADILKKSKWDSPVWEMFRKKMKAVIDNCKVRP